MIRLALAAAVVAFTAGAHPAAYHPHRPALTVVRAVIVGGTPQSAHAYVAPGEKKYYAEFPGTLLVRWSGPKVRDGWRKVRFTCVNDCSFLATDQPDNGTKVDRVADVENAYEAKVVNGVAALRVTIEGDVLGQYVVRA